MGGMGMPPQQMMGQFGGGIGCQQQMQPPMHCSSRCSLLSPTGASSIAAAASAAASATAAACNDRRCFLMCAEIVQKGRPFSCMVFITCYGCWKREQGRGGMLDLVLLTSNHMLQLTNENENEASFSFSSRTITFNFYRNFFVHMSTHTRKNESFSSSNRKKRP
jgi:hypothetical protein